MLTRIQKGSNDYAVYEKKCDVSELDQISIQMINSNQKTNIGLASIICESMNEECEKILFDITSRIQLNEYISRKMSQEEFRDMLMSLINTIEGLDEYMINIEQIILDPENVFINEVNKTILFICLPLRSYKSEGKLFDFFRNVIKNSYVECEANETNYFNSAHNIVQNESNFSLEKLRDAIEISGPQAVADDSAEAASTDEIIHESVIPAFDPNAGVLEAVEQDEADMPVVPAPAMTKKQEKKGLFGKLFGDKKKKAEPASAPAVPSAIAAAHQSEPAPAVQIPNVLAGAGNAEQQSEADFVPKGLSGLRKKTEKTSAKPPKPPKAPKVKKSKKSKEVAQPSVPLQQVPPPVQHVAPQVQQVPPSVQQVAPQVQQVPPPVQQVAPPVQQVAPSVQPVQQATLVGDPLPAFEHDDYIGTTLLKYDSPETTALKGGPSIRAYLIRRNNRQSIEIRKSVFAIGRDRNDQDLQLNDNTAIGHKHAYIIRKNSFFFLVDNNSMNHTYINDQLLEPNVEYKLNNGDKVVFADEEFDFRIF
ncbi:MAG: FHA domain-containing protein [Ruminococcus sp.]|nr:FHA domain-containing protein [Ruminococcus sp.]